VRGRAARRLTREAVNRPEVTGTCLINGAALPAMVTGKKRTGRGEVGPVQFVLALAKRGRRDRATRAQEPTPKRARAAMR
jgi:hypothetical protein